MHFNILRVRRKCTYAHKYCTVVRIYVPLEFILKDSRRSMSTWHMIMCISEWHLGQALLRITGSAASLTGTCRTHFILSEFSFVYCSASTGTQGITSTMFRGHYLYLGPVFVYKIHWYGKYISHRQRRRGPGRSGKPSHRPKSSAASAAVHQWFTTTTTTIKATSKNKSPKCAFVTFPSSYS